MLPRHRGGAERRDSNDIAQVHDDLFSVGEDDGEGVMLFMECLLFAWSCCVCRYEAMNTNLTYRRQWNFAHVQTVGAQPGRVAD
jgi:hypothetical protein